MSVLILVKIIKLSYLIELFFIIKSNTILIFQNILCKFNIKINLEIISNISYNNLDIDYLDYNLNKTNKWVNLNIAIIS